MTPVRIDVHSGTRARSGQTAAYVLGASDALLVDPSAKTDPLVDACRRRGVAHLAVTHHHRTTSPGSATAQRLSV